MRNRWQLVTSPRNRLLKASSIAPGSYAPDGRPAEVNAPRKLLIIGERRRTPPLPNNCGRWRSAQSSTDTDLPKRPSG